MGVRVFTGCLGEPDPYGPAPQAVLVCDTSDTAFGPIMDNRETALAFLENHFQTYDEDPRTVPSGELEHRYFVFRDARERRQ